VSLAAAAQAAPPPPGGILGFIEKVGNKVPHPVMMFLYLIAFIIILSQILYWFDVSVTTEVAHHEDGAVGGEPVDGPDDPIVHPPPPNLDDGDYVIETETIPVKGLLTTDGIRFIFSSFVRNFANFTVVATIFVAMIGVGVAEEAGLMGALIRKLVKVSPRWALGFIIIFVGGLSSIATDAGYLILIPLGAAAFLSVGRHPLAGLAAAYAGVSAAFAVNVLITPADALVTEMTNEAIQIVNPGDTISVVANLYFNIVSTVAMALVITLVTERLIEPRLGKYEAEPAVGAIEAGTPASSAGSEVTVEPAAEARGLRFALYAVLAAALVIVLLTAFPDAPLRDPETGDIIGTTPFMDSLIFLITLVFLAAGIGFGIGAGTIKSSNDVIGGVVKTFASLAGLIFMLLIISQFIAQFNYTNMPAVLATGLADLLERADIGALPLLIGFMLVIMLLDIIMPGVLPKWAIFAPIFIPLFLELDVAPQTVLAAYRIGDSPMNVITPLMVYLPFIIIVAQRYQRDAGIGTIMSLMIPYTLIVAIAWIILFIVWYLLGIPLGPGYPVEV
jgi:aminobenzoyl-glutamate transport protein